ISGLTGHALLLRVHAIRDAKGAFLGISSIAINLSSLREHFAKINVGAAGVVGLRRFDNGASVVRVPAPAGMGNEPAEHHPARQAIVRGEASGTQERRSITDGIWRIYAHRVIGAQKPFFIEIGLAESDYLAQWRRDTALLAVASLLFLGILALVFYRLARAEARERQKALELRDSDDSLRNILQTTLDGFWQVDAQGRLLEVNPSYCRQSGYTREELIGMHISELDANGDPAATEARMARLASNGSDQFETRHRRKDGSIWHAEVSTTLRDIVHGQIVAFVRDITERKQNEQHLERLLAEKETLLENQRTAYQQIGRLSQALEQTAESVVITDLAARIEYVNEAYVRHSGYTREELIGRNSRILQSGNTPRETYAAMWSALSRGQTWRGEFRNRRKDGSEYIESAVISPVREAEGKITHYVGAKTDITLRKQAEGDLRQAKETAEAANVAKGKRAAELVIANTELVFQNEEKGKRSAELVIANTELAFQNEEKGKRSAELVLANTELAFQNEEKGKRAVELTFAREAAEAASIAKSRFLASMSHEIRTPMNGILGMAQVLLMPNISEAERLDYARTILGSGQTLMTLLNDILDLSKIEAGKVEFESIAMEPGRVVGETRGLFAEIARAKGLRIEADWSGAPQRYLGDPHRLRQMLSNLVGNAVKFTAEGCIRIEAREIARDAGAAVLEFSVADTGIGIAQDEQVLLFQQFSQTDNSITRRYGGSGLGLSIVAGMARLMGGDVGVESEAGRGSRFWFRIRAGLSVADTHIGEAQPFPAALAFAGAGPTRLSGRVLVVEDNP
ncbi:MAG: PAS domain S-box protein, partial [Proteobacteria bacterium]|nr:PAS domain S-box protein [Pseudomonadota bacterium]